MVVDEMRPFSRGPSPEIAARLRAIAIARRHSFNLCVPSLQVNDDSEWRLPILPAALSQSGSRHRYPGMSPMNPCRVYLLQNLLIEL